jgi:hypothetical protein
MRPAVSYLLVADENTYRCRNWDQLVERLAWAHRSEIQDGSKAWRTTIDNDRPLIRPKLTRW